MNNLLPKSLRILDHSNTNTIFNKPNNAILSFALDDAIATTIGEHSSLPTVRFWVHDQTLVLGIPDSRLPNLQPAVNYVRQQGYDVIIRNSGGLAVLLDKHVLNMSFILPSSRHLSIHAGYELMYHFIKELFHKETDKILAYEIEGSYCPGDYDLSIDGKKFAGISQRRVRNGVAIQIYIDVAGNSQERATVVRHFYELALNGKEQSFDFPSVNPSVMASISELLQTNFSVRQIVNRIINLLQSKGVVTESELTCKEYEIFAQRLNQMEKRNEKISY